MYYSVRGFPTYGRLSGKCLDDLRAGERVEVDPNKRDPLDFVLWKAAKPGEPAWDSPWGPGRPGWHIECSAMSADLLGKHFDIHGGGQDLQFPHHENEIAQSEGAHGYTFVNYWMHNGFVRVDNEKMSKSLGNFFTIREVLEKYDAEVVRFFILRAHYRSPLNYSDDHLDDAKGALTRLYTALKRRRATAAAPDWSEPAARASARRWTTTSTPRRRSRCCSTWRAKPTGAMPSPHRPCAAWAGCWACCSASRRISCRRGLPQAAGRSRNRGADRSAAGGAQGEGFRRVRPHPRCVDGGRHRAGRRGRRYHLAPRLTRPPSGMASSSLVLIGAAGWQHPAWRDRFYPDDMPDDWQLSYYNSHFRPSICPRPSGKPHPGQPGHNGCTTPGKGSVLCWSRAKPSRPARFGADRPGHAGVGGRTCLVAGRSAGPACAGATHHPAGADREPLFVFSRSGNLELMEQASTLVQVMGY